MREEWVSGRQQLKFEDFVSICPYTKQSDLGHIELNYMPDQRRIDVKKLQAYLDSFKTKEVPMEVVPIKILKHCIEECVNQPPPTLRAAPKDVEVEANFQDGRKGMRTSVRFSKVIPSTR